MKSTVQLFSIMKINDYTLEYRLDKIEMYFSNGGRNFSSRYCKELISNMLEAACFLETKGSLFGGTLERTPLNFLLLPRPRLNLFLMEAQQSTSSRFYILSQ